MSLPDRELPETLDLIAKLVASVSARLDRQGETLAGLATAQAKDRRDRDGRAGDPDQAARLAAEAVRRALSADLQRILDAMEELNGRKALLRQRLRAATQEETRANWWRRHVPFALTLLGAYTLVLVFGLAFPRTMAEHRLTCRAIGGTWYAPDARLPAACTLWLPEEEQAGAS